jgi:hypothetical protein
VRYLNLRRYPRLYRHSPLPLLNMMR